MSEENEIRNELQRLQARGGRFTGNNLVLGGTSTLLYHKATIYLRKDWPQTLVVYPSPLSIAHNGTI